MATTLHPMLSLVAGIGLFGAVTDTAKPPRPNIVLILCDDLGFSDLGCYGSQIRTPHLDRLAAEGMRFTQFYNCAVCVTTRAALTTGVYPRQGKGGLLRRNMVTLGEVLQQAGYATALTGKWHLGSSEPKRPIDRGFEEYYGLLSGCANYFNPAKQDPIFYNGGHFRPFAHNNRPIKKFPPDFYATDAFTDHAIGTIRRLAASDKPFLVHLCYTPLPIFRCKHPRRTSIAIGVNLPTATSHCADGDISGRSSSVCSIPNGNCRRSTARRAPFGTTTT